MAILPEFDCILVDATTQETLRTLLITLVPRIGEEIRLIDMPGSDSDRVYRVTNVRYEIPDRQRLRLGNLDRVIVSVVPQE